MIEFLISGNEIYIVDDWLRFYSEAYGQIFHCAEIMIAPSYNENKYLIFNGGTILTLEMLQTTPFLINKAYRLIPGELLDKHHLDISSISNTDNTMARVKIFEVLLDNIKEELDKFHQYFCNAKTRLHLYHYCMNRIAMALCTEIQSDGNKIFEHKVVLTPLRKLWITYKARLKDSLVHRA
jgi:hypothetical protein